MTKIILPTYVTKQPSTGKNVTFRPFTIKEEKALLLALEENDLDTVASAIKNTIKACTESEVDPNKVPYYDLEYLFLQIRAKSVGETIDLIGSCDCSETAKTKFIADISKTEVKHADFDPVIPIPGTKYTVKMRHPTLSDFVASLKAEESSGAQTVASCITDVYTDDEVFEWSMKEKVEFVESMSPLQQKGIAAFMDAMPVVELDASYKCQSCGLDHTQVLSGFSNFFI